jgi:Bacterial protein of unknown function (DUF885)
MTARRGRFWGVLLLTTLCVVPGWTQDAGVQSPAPDLTVPGDLKPLLAAPQSEMRLVTLLYTTDRTTLNGDFDTGRAGGRGGRGGREGGAGRGAGPAGTQGPGLSVRRIARLKRFELDWQTALGKIEASRLSAPARTDLQDLQRRIGENLAQLDSDGASIAALAPLMPFATTLVDLSEARIRMEDVDSRKAAGQLVAVTRQIADIRARLEKDPGAVPGVTKEVAARGADAVDGLRNSMTTWFNFSNGYDPLFTWWMGMPSQQLEAALQGYSAFLRELPVSAEAAQPAAAAPIAAAPAPAIDEVPDLEALLRLPQDEMTPIVERFVNPDAAAGRSDTGGRSGGNAAGGRAATNSPGSGRPKQYYVEWLAALNTLDFDRLSRNAQVDYLFIKNASQRYLARADTTLDPNPPRKTDATGITGAARGRAGLLQDLADEMIPYSPEQLIALAEKEFAWCDAEMRKASRQMGFGDDWKQALEKVKGMHVEPGRQPAVIRDMLFEAVDYVRNKDLLTVPAIASESLHMSMMSPEAQLVNPFFLGGAQIIVSYPTNTMEYDARLQSMRGNNIPFSHATAFHEMIPGHNLVGYVGARHAGYRARIGGSTPFYTEGWPLYWELLMYDLGFHDTPEEKVGALFWRMHRCARIIFSLKFHTGQWSPQESIDFLADRVGHERDNATAEVRRSFQGGYGPLYQAGYLLGGLQLRALRRELVDSKQLTDKQFHDEILRQGNMPIALIRLAVGRQRLTRDTPVDWKFYGADPGTATPH